MIKPLLWTLCLAALALVSSCANLQVAQQVQAGRAALQTGRPDDAVVYLTRAAEQNPDYTIPYRIPVSVLSYLGRGYYETGKDMEARITLEKALGRNKEDHLARLYLGLSLARSEGLGRGRMDLESGLKGIQGWLDYLAADNLSGVYYDPAQEIRSSIQRTLFGKLDPEELLSTAQRIGSEVDEEIDKARRDESRSRYDRGGGDS